MVDKSQIDIIHNAIEVLRAKQIPVVSEINTDKNLSVVYWKDVEEEINKIINKIKAL